MHVFERTDIPCERNTPYAALCTVDGFLSLTTKRPNLAPVVGNTPDVPRLDLIPAYRLWAGSYVSCSHRLRGKQTYSIVR